MNLTALISTLNDPHLTSLADTLGKSNFTRLEEILKEPNVDVPKLMNALREYNLIDNSRVNLDLADAKGSERSPNFR